MRWLKITENLIKLLKLTINTLLEVSQKVLHELQNKNEDKIVDINNIKDYIENLTRFLNYCNSLNDQKFNDEIKDIFKRSNELINFFSCRVFIIVKNNNLITLEPTFREIPQLILNYLSTITNYVKTSTEAMKNESHKISQNLNDNVSQKSLTNESMIYLTELDFITIVGTGILKFLNKFIRIIDFRSNSIQNMTNSITNGINRLSSRIRSASPGFEGLKDIFLSKEMGYALGGTIAVLGIFVILRRFFNKTIQFIKNKWSQLMSYSRGED